MPDSGIQYHQFCLHLILGLASLLTLQKKEVRQRAYSKIQKGLGFGNCQTGRESETTSYKAGSVMYLFVCDSFLHQREQFIGEEVCMGVKESNPLRLIDVCHDLSPHRRKIHRHKIIYKVEQLILKILLKSARALRTWSHLKLLYWLFGFNSSQNLILAQFPL